MRKLKGVSSVTAAFCKLLNKVVLFQFALTSVMVKTADIHVDIAEMETLAIIKLACATHVQMAITTVTNSVIQVP